MYYLHKNLKEYILIISGSLLVTIGYFFVMTETYNHLINKKFSKGYLIIGLFILLSFLISINTHIKKVDLFRLIKHIILTNCYFCYQELGNISLSLYTYHNGMINNLQGIGGGLILQRGLF